MSDTIITDYKGVTFYYLRISFSAIHSADKHIIKYINPANNSEKFFEIGFLGNPTWRIKLEKDTLILFYDSNTDYLVVTTGTNEQGYKSYHLEHVDKKNLAGYFFNPDLEGIYKFENNSWVKTDSYENEGRYMLTPFQYEKSKIVRIPMDRILEGIRNEK